MCDSSLYIIFTYIRAHSVLRNWYNICTLLKQLKVFRLHLKSSAEIKFLSVRTSVDIVITSVFSWNIKLKWSIFLTLLKMWLLVGTLWHCCGDCSYYSVTFSWRLNNSWNYFCNYNIYSNKRPLSNKYPLPLFMGKGDYILPKLDLGH